MDNPLETLTVVTPAGSGVEATPSTDAGGSALSDAAGSLPISAESVVSPELELVGASPAADEVAVIEPATELVDSVTVEPEAVQAAAEPVDTVSSDSALGSVEPVDERRAS